MSAEKNIRIAETMRATYEKRSHKLYEYADNLKI